jgi:hypothetical protein
VSTTTTTFRRITPNFNYPNSYVIEGVAGNVEDLLAGFDFNGRRYDFVSYYECGYDPTSGHTRYVFQGVQS